MSVSSHFKWHLIVFSWTSEKQVILNYLPKFQLSDWNFSHNLSYWLHTRLNQSIAKLGNSLLSRDVTSVLSVQMVVKGKWQCKLLLQNIYMYMIVTLEVVYDHVGKCHKLALCYFIQINLILFCLTTIWKSEISSKKSRDWNLRIR